ncbi:MAG: hypothetical protein ABJE99_06095 [Roseobacter sp.]
MPESTNWCGPQRSEDTGLSILVVRRGPTKRPPYGALAFGFSEPQAQQNRIED